MANHHHPPPPHPSQGEGQDAELCLLESRGRQVQAANSWPGHPTPAQLLVMLFSTQRPQEQKVKAAVNSLTQRVTHEWTVLPGQCSPGGFIKGRFRWEYSDPPHPVLLWHLFELISSQSEG